MSLDIYREKEIVREEETNRYGKERVTYLSPLRSIHEQRERQRKRVKSKERMFWR